jgi:SAM-dependent methyltransferase
MALESGERQVAPTTDGIRHDHVARYRWAAKTLPPGSRVLDVACGVGYGAAILAEAGHRVVAIDRDKETIEYAQRHYERPGVTYKCAGALSVAGYEDDSFDAVVCFETIEHLAEPASFLHACRAVAPHLLISAPNEDVFPWQAYRFHFRHYTRDQLDALLIDCGYRVSAWLGQEGPESDVEPGVNGRTLVAVAARAEHPALTAAAPELPERPVPAHVALVGLGPSAAMFFEIAKRVGGRRAVADEVWGINALGDVLRCDLVLHMDDIRVQETRAAANPSGNIAQMVKWLKTYDGTVITSRAHPDYPCLVEFPLERVVQETGFSYFNSTAAYAVAYAILIGVKKLSIFGFDFTYPNAHHAEAGRAAVEFWLGIAAARGIEIAVCKTSTLMDAMADPAERLYGYDTLDVTIAVENGKAIVTKTPKPESALPTAEEIEARYDHNRPPNRIVAAEAEVAAHAE